MTKMRDLISKFELGFIALLLLGAHEAGASGETRIRQGLVVTGTTTLNGALSATAGATVASGLTSSGSLTASSLLKLPAQAVSSSGSITALSQTKSLVSFTSASAKTLHGIQAGTDGQTFVIFNAGAGALTLKHESGTDSAANRILLPGSSDLQLSQYQGVALTYISSSSRWGLVGGVTSNFDSYFHATTGHNHTGATGQGPLLSAIASLSSAVGDTGKFLKSNGSLAEWQSITAESLVAPGSSGNVLTSNGTNWVSSTPSSFTPPRSYVTVTTANGHGSTNTAIRRYSTVLDNVGTAITYADSAANGASFTINEDGVYSMTLTDFSSAGSHLGISMDSTQLTSATGIASITNSHRLLFFVSNNQTETGSRTRFLPAGTVVRVHTDGTPDGGLASNTMFSITQVSK
jgi:hypothetical protein